MVEVIIVLACVASMLYLIMTTIVEAWASWDKDDRYPDSTASAEDGASA